MTAKRVAVLCGGDSREREVSLRSGQAVCDALNEAGFTAECLDLHTLDEAGRVRGYDGAFIAMHGGWGEDGTLQACLEEMGIPYTGSGPKASALAMDKIQTHETLRGRINMVMDYCRLPQNYDDIIARLGQDVVVKPTSGGSTVGVSVILGLTPGKLEEAYSFATYQGVN